MEVLMAGGNAFDCACIRETISFIQGSAPGGGDSNGLSHGGDTQTDQVRVTVDHAQRLSGQ